LGTFDVELRLKMWFWNDCPAKKYFTKHHRPVNCLDEVVLPGYPGGRRTAVISS